MKLRMTKIATAVSAVAAMAVLSGCATDNVKPLYQNDNVAQTNVTDGALPIAPSIYRYQMPNGLTVMLEKRADKSKSMECRMVVRVGSLQEQENERGLAHYVEHMAFNGTKDFPGQTIFKELEAHGMMLGADVNAVTTLGDTTYKLTLLRVDDKAMDTAVHTLSQWASAVSFEPAAFEREREIIVSEWRLRQGIGSRINGPLQSLRYRGSPSADRDPIGLISVVRNAPVERAKAFYDRWYQPQNMTLYIVGDFDIAQMQQRIEHYFGDLPKGKNTTPKDWGVFNQPVAAKDRVALIFDDEASDRIVQIMIQTHRDETLNTVNGQWRDTLERLMLDILGDRLEILTDNEAAAKLSVPEASWVLSPKDSQVLMIGHPKVGQSYEDVIGILSEELSRMAKVGPTKAELSRAVSRRLNRLRSQAVNQSRYSNASRADRFANAINSGLPMMDKTQEYEMVATFMQSVTPAHVRAAAGQLFNDTVKLAVIGPKTRENTQITAEKLLKAFDAGKARGTTAFTAKPLVPELDTKAPAMPGVRLSETLVSPLPSATLEKYVLDNGLTLLVMSDPTLGGKTSVNLRIKGGTSAVENGLVRVPTALGLPMKSGIGNLKHRGIVKVATQNDVKLRSYSQMLHHGFRGEAADSAMPALMALMTLRLQQPHYSQAALSTAVDRSIDGLKHLPAERRFMDAISTDGFVNGDKLVVTAQKLRDTTDVKAIADLDAALIGDPSKMVLSVVGQASPADLYKAVAPWAGSWKKRTAHHPIGGWRDQKIVPNVKAADKSYAWSMSPKTMVQMHYRAPMTWTTENAAMLDMVQPMMDLALREGLRTELSGVYTVTMNQLLTREPSPYYLGRLNFTAAPERADELIDKAKKTVDNFADYGLTQAQYRQAQEIRRVNIERDIKDAYYWSEALAMSGGNPDEVALYSVQKRLAEAPSLDKVNAFVKQLYANKPTIFRLVPKQGVSTQAKTAAER